MCGSRSSGITRLDNKLSQHIEILFSDLNQLPLKQFEEIAKFAQQKQQEFSEFVEQKRMTFEKVARYQLNHKTHLLKHYQEIVSITKLVFYKSR